jgi:protein-S-isoprenylcysteine O-methyltransferase Ste14
MLGKAMIGFGQLVGVMALLVFGPAGTLRFVEGWVFLLIFAGAALAITLYLARHDPKLLERRTKAGPAAEKEPKQKVIQLAASASFLAVLIVPALDHRFGWSHLPGVVVVAGNDLVAVGFLTVFYVFKENTFTSAVVEVAEDQRVIDTGPYAIVRHPMYSGALALVAGIPLALGSLVGLVTFVPFVAVIVARLLGEERFLSEQLKGYVAYCERTPYRLIPRVW